MTLLLHSTAIESGCLRPKMVSMYVSVSSLSSSWSSSCFLAARSSSRARRKTWSLSMSPSASSTISSQGRISPILVSVHSFSSCLSLSPLMNSRFLVVSPCVEMAPMRYFQHLLWVRARLVKDTRHCFWIRVSEAAGESDNTAKSAATNVVAADRLAALGTVAGFQTRHCGGRSNGKLHPGVA